MPRGKCALCDLEKDLKLSQFIPRLRVHGWRRVFSCLARKTDTSKNAPDVLLVFER
jgi:hypothetical protein